MGHRPGSREFQKYANWLALDTRKAKQRLQDHKEKTLTIEVEKLRDQLSVANNRQRELRQVMESMQTQIEANNRIMFEQVRDLLQQAGIGQPDQQNNKESCMITLATPSGAEFD